MPKTKISVSLDEELILEMLATKHRTKSRSQMAEEAARHFLKELKST